MRYSSSLNTQQDMFPSRLQNESDLVSVALALGARKIPGWSPQEDRLATQASPLAGEWLADLAKEIQEGADPLGNAFIRLRSLEDRRTLGATFTPKPIVTSMLRWTRTTGIEPARIIEPGSGSGRFLMMAARLFASARLVGFEVDPLAAMIARANLAACGFVKRAQILLCDYRYAALPNIAGVTLYVGNPPYVRHHLIDSVSKRWLTRTCAQLGHGVSQLSGLHVYFILATALKAKTGDFGVFITSAEWLDVNYGQLVRQLFLNQLGCESLTIIEPTARPFEDAASTAAISTFVVGCRPPSIRVARVADSRGLGDLTAGKHLHRDRLRAESRWSHLTRTQRSIPTDHVELGEFCRVHRGQVTGANQVWIAGPHSRHLPSRVLFPTVTRARELFNANGVLADGVHLRDVIDLPADLDELSNEERKTVVQFLGYAKRAGADSGYIAKARKAWWSVGLRSPAPILATYMARRPPAFVRNLAGARHINIAHGLYPREALSADILEKLAKYLSESVSMRDGRTYAGGLTKFEPREMERLIVPSPALLSSAI